MVSGNYNRSVITSIDLVNRGREEKETKMNDDREKSTPAENIGYACLILFGMLIVLVGVSYIIYPG